MDLGLPLWPHTQEHQTAETVLEKKGKAGGLTLLDWGQTCRNQNSVVLAYRQTYKPTEQNTEPRN